MLTITRYFDAHPRHRKIVFYLFGFLSLTPLISAPIALILGFLVAVLIGNPFPSESKKSVNWLLKIAVVGLGFGMNATTALKAGKEGFIFTVVSIIAVLSVGFLLTKLLRIDKISGFLISAGTAICGGSAIAAVAPIIKAKQDQISVALAVVFTLNSVALLLFPTIGHLLNLSQHDFGLWCAIAIHDTSSVVGAASKYGTEALEVATTVKLARALWIIPLSLLSVLLFKSKESKIKIPWFIGLFVLAMLINSYFPAIQPLSKIIVVGAKAGLTLTLYLIGSGLSLKALKSMGLKPLLLAVILWIGISVTSLWVILSL